MQRNTQSGGEGGGGGGSANHVYEILSDVFREAVFDGLHVGMSFMNYDTSKFYGYLEAANQEMYQVCLTKLSIIVLLFHNKCHKVTDKAFDMLLDLLRELIHNGIEKFPESLYAIKR